MTWLTIAQLIAQYGLPFVMQLMQNHASNVPVTPEAFEALKAHAKTYEELLAAAQARAAGQLPPPAPSP